MDWFLILAPLGLPIGYVIGLLTERAIWRKRNTLDKAYITGLEEALQARREQRQPPPRSQTREQAGPVSVPPRVFFNPGPINLRPGDETLRVGLGGTGDSTWQIRLSQHIALSALQLHNARAIYVKEFPGDDKTDIAAEVFYAAERAIGRVNQYVTARLARERGESRSTESDDGPQQP